MATAAAPPDADGWCSLSLHAGASIPELQRAAADPERLLVVEVSPRFPRTLGLPPDHRHAVHVDQIDVLVESDAAPLRSRGPAAHRRRPRDRRARQRLRPRRRHAADRDRRRAVGDRQAARRGRGRRLRRPLGDVHDRAHAPAPGRQGDQPQGPVRRRLGRDLRRRDAGALRVARRQPRRRLPAGRGRQLARADRPQPADDDDQRRDRDRHPGPGGRRHDRRHPVLGDRRPRGLHLRAGALARGRARCSACPRR